MAGPYIAPGTSYYLPNDDPSRTCRAGQAAAPAFPNINVGAYSYGRGAPVATDATRAIQPPGAQPQPGAQQAQPQPFELRFAPPPAAPSLPQLNVNIAGSRGVAAPRQTATTAPVDEFTPPKGIPSNAIPVLR